LRTPLWIPAEERVNKSNINAFIRYAEQITKKPVSGYQDLYEWSIADIAEFWKSIWVHSGIIHSKTYRSILSGEEMPGAKWFEGSELNFAENLLRYRDTHTAIISAREDLQPVRISYEELYLYVAKTAAYLKNIGIKKGDVVAGYISNVPEAIIAMLASASIGALWTSASPDFGFQGVVDRFGQTKPKVLFATEEYSYGGKIFNNLEKINQIKTAIPEIETVILVPLYYNFQHETKKVTGLPGTFYFSEILKNNSNEIVFEQLPFDHPVYIMYSSGTTGVPKCIVHGAGGTLLQHYKELALHTDLNRHDVITYYTTCGWMMWNWMVSSLMIGSTIFLYDGNPVHPDAGVLWRYAEEEKISIFGTSPKYLSSIEKMRLSPMTEFDLSSLRVILSTGAPLPDSSFRWVYNSVKKDVQLSSISGGTDIISCFMLGCPVLPVYPGEIQCRGLGMKVEAFDKNGFPVIDQKGELVCTRVFPSMPVFFWNDPDGSKYRSAYFEYFPGVWRHGDYIKITSDGGVVVYGRSDSTLNPGGIRIGTSEIYRIVEAIDEISDSLVIGQNQNNDVSIILFVVLAENYKLTDELRRKIKDSIRTSASPRHVPQRILQVKDIPRTLNGKKVEVAVSKIFNGETVDNMDAIANPEALKEFFNYIDGRNI
jgi:acetoacetyl-CoA synthetase